MRLHRVLAFALASAALLALPAAGQGGVGQRGQRALPPPRQAPPPARQRLIQEINRQFMNQARNRLGLTPVQWPRFQRIVWGYAQVSSGLELEERRTGFALREQLRLGAAGNPDSTSRLVTGLNAIRSRIAETSANEARDLEPVLTPAQRARWQVLRDRFAQQVRAAALQRPAGGPDQQP